MPKGVDATPVMGLFARPALTGVFFWRIAPPNSQKMGLRTPGQFQTTNPHPLSLLSDHRQSEHWDLKAKS
jgi:hypothetical protein